MNTTATTGLFGVPNDSLWVSGDGFIWWSLGSLIGGEQEFTLSESYFDDVLDGSILFHALFTESIFGPHESILSAILTVNGTYCAPPSAVPVPGAVWLFGSALAGLIGFGRRRREQN